MLSRLFRGGAAAAPTSPPGPAMASPPIAELNDLADCANANQLLQAAINVGGACSGRDDGRFPAKQSTARQDPDPARCTAVSDTSQAADPPDRARQQNGEVTDSEGLTFSSDGSGAAGTSGAAAVGLRGKAESPSASATRAGCFDSSAAQAALLPAVDSSTADVTAVAGAAGDPQPEAEQSRSTVPPGSRRRKGRHPVSAAEAGPGTTAGTTAAATAAQKSQAAGAKQERAQQRARARRRAAGNSKPRRKKKQKGLYADLVGREVDIPAAIFDIQVPGLCFTAKVLRRDPSHTGAVVIRFPEDGSSFWLPATEVRRYMHEGDERRSESEGGGGLVGQGAEEAAAGVLVSLSAATASDCAPPSDGPGSMQRMGIAAPGKGDSSLKRRSMGEATSVLAAPPTAQPGSAKRVK